MGEKKKGGRVSKGRILELNGACMYEEQRRKDEQEQNP